MPRMKTTTDEKIYSKNSLDKRSTSDKSNHLWNKWLTNIFNIYETNFYDDTTSYCYFEKYNSKWTFWNIINSFIFYFFLYFSKEYFL